MFLLLVTNNLHLDEAVLIHLLDVLGYRKLLLQACELVQQVPGELGSDSPVSGTSFLPLWHHLIKRLFILEEPHHDGQDDINMGMKGLSRCYYFSYDLIEGRDKHCWGKTPSCVSRNLVGCGENIH